MPWGKEEVARRHRDLVDLFCFEGLKLCFKRVLAAGPAGRPCPAANSRTLRRSLLRRLWTRRQNLHPAGFVQDPYERIFVGIYFALLFPPSEESVLNLLFFLLPPLTFA